MSGTDDQSTTTPSRWRSPHLWVSSTYFAEGFPYSVIHSLAEILFKEMGASLQAIGLTSLFHLPWNLKFLWGPFLDGFATKRRWLIWTEVALSLLLLLLAFATTLDHILGIASVIFVAMAFIAATHDIAIDGYYLEALDEDAQSRFVGYRATAYKIAMMIVSGPLVLLIAGVGWFVGILVTAVIFGVVLAYHWRFLPRAEHEKRPIQELLKALFQLRVLALAAAVALVIAGVRTWLQTDLHIALSSGLEELAPWLFRISLSGWIGLLLLLLLTSTLLALGPIRRRIAQKDSFYARAFVDFLEQAQVGRILAFVVLFRAGESFLVKMRYPFLRDAGMSMAEYGFASGTVGIIFSFVGTLLGGHLIAKHSLRRWIWPFVLSQNVLNLLFAGLAWHLAANPGEEINLTMLTAIISIESLGSGLGTAVFMVYLMRCCRPDFKAAHMAIVTALMSVSFTLAGVCSGFLAEWMGFGNYFGFSFLATIPGMALIFFIPHLDKHPASA